MKKEPKLNNLNPDQKRQILTQWKEQSHNNLVVNIELSGHGEKLKDFVVDKDVWNSAVVSSRYYSSYLYYNNQRLFAGKRTLDMGAGTGLLGITMAMHGAKEVVLSDISKPAIENAQKNVAKFSLGNICKVVQGDLFENVKGSFHFIIFNHPFFNDFPPEGDTIGSSMLASSDVIEHFLTEAPDHLKEGGIVTMPFFELAGEANNPVIQAPKYGFKVNTVFQSDSYSGLQSGSVSIHELSR